MHLEGANILQSQSIWGMAKIPAELRDCMEVGLLGCWREIADSHVLDHATAQRADLGHLGTSCLRVGCHAQILSDRRPITRPRRFRRDSGFVQSPYESARGTVGSLHEVAASSVFLRFFLGPARIDGSFRRPTSVSASTFRGDAGTDLRAAQCIKRRYEPATNVSRARPFGPHPLHCRGAERLQFRIFFSSVTPLGYAATAASKCAPSFHMRPMRTASFLATATRARLGPMVLTSFRPQLRKAKRRLTVVSNTLAAS
jgi:hypothetical protein